MRRASIALLGGTALLGGVLAIVFRPSNGTSGAAAAPSWAAKAESTATNAPLAPPSALEPAATDSTRVRALREAPATTPSPPAPDGLEDGGQAPHPAGDFGWKYARSSEDELRSAHRKLVRDYERELARCVERRIRAGNFEEARVEGLDLEALLAELTARGQPHALVTASGNRPIRSADDAEGVSAVRWMRFERFDESALYELADELDWLKRAAP